MANTVLVTGASSGIGRGLALKFGQEGWEVTLVARRKENLEKVAKEVEDAGGKSHVFATDLTVEGNPDSAIKFAIEKMGKIGTLVNNAGLGRFEMVPDIKDKSYQEQFQLNVWACMAMVRSAVPHFKKNGGGQIINIGSIVGYLGISKGSIYSSTKWALRGLNESWREELYPDNIKVCYVGPGFVLTEFNGRKEGGTSEEQEWAMVPGDVAHAVYCVSTQGPNSDIKEISIQVLDRS
jgi:short-subunit dehydrogenase